MNKTFGKFQRSMEFNVGIRFRNNAMLYFLI